MILYLINILATVDVSLKPSNKTDSDNWYKLEIKLDEIIFPVDREICDGKIKIVNFSTKQALTGDATNDFTDTLYLNPSTKKCKDKGYCYYKSEEVISCPKSDSTSNDVYYMYIEIDKSVKKAYFMGFNVSDLKNLEVKKYNALALNGDEHATIKNDGILVYAAGKEVDCFKQNVEATNILMKASELITSEKSNENPQSKDVIVLNEQGEPITNKTSSVQAITAEGEKIDDVNETQIGESGEQNNSESMKSNEENKTSIKMVEKATSIVKHIWKKAKNIGYWLWNSLLTYSRITDARPLKKKSQRKGQLILKGNPVKPFVSTRADISSKTDSRPLPGFNLPKLPTQELVVNESSIPRNEITQSIPETSLAPFVSQDSNTSPNENNQPNPLIDSTGNPDSSQQPQQSANEPTSSNHGQGKPTDIQHSGNGNKSDNTKKTILILFVVVTTIVFCGVCVYNVMKTK